METTRIRINPHGIELEQEKAKEKFRVSKNGPNLFPVESNIQRSRFSQRPGSRFYVSPGLSLELSDLFALKK
ncbi:hypothetical protein CEXT_780671 [Caerostris extrusa]|uniref:Uncharacterized protein n=1 Tax=Caerostris extrusa TaxID=172846 RepID=A0AAV4TSW3_CAEEX|nr:hypothetical protein CEXT_780671 [Caerostris extrusa]